MEIPIVSGIYLDSGPDIRTSYPVNCLPVPQPSGLSNAYLRPADGVVAFGGSGSGVCRGGIEWKDACYRVMGSDLVRVDGAGNVVVLGNVGGAGTTMVTFDYSFDRLAIASAGNLFYWNGTTLVQVTDPDLGNVLDVVWVDGYFMTTDGSSLVVTELSDPTQVNPLKYGSSEADPDPVVALVKIRNEVYALNRHTIEVFDNVGGSLFPFQRIEGAQIQKGTVGTHACCVFMDTVAFLGGGRNEPPSIYMGGNGVARKISTQEIDDLLLNYTSTQLSVVKLEERTNKNHKLLYVHLNDRCIVYDAAASEAFKVPVWYTLTSSTVGFSEYRAKHHVWCYDRWLVADTQSTALGVLTDDVASHWGNIVRWEFGTAIMYNKSAGAIFHSMELLGITGRSALGHNPQISTSYSLDGVTWSQDHYINVGTIGDRNKRMCWFKQGSMRRWRLQRFRGDSRAMISVARLEASIEPLAN